MRVGDIEFKFHGKGKNFFLLNLKGTLLSIITLGVYSFWFSKDLYAYYINNLTLQKGEQIIRLKSTAKTGDIFVLSLLNGLTILLTLGIGYAWVVTRTINFVFSSIQPDGNIDLDTIQQTEPDYITENSEEEGSFFNIDFA
jgi:uncharacterized membrane protein YjgN (DUF898 family)